MKAMRQAEVFAWVGQNWPSGLFSLHCRFLKVGRWSGVAYWVLRGGCGCSVSEGSRKGWILPGRCHLGFAGLGRVLI